MGLSFSSLFFIIKKVKMNPKVFRFAKRPCALIVVSLSNVSDMEEYSALRADHQRVHPPPPKKDPFLNILGISFNGKMILKNQATE